MDTPLFCSKPIGLEAPNHSNAKPIELIKSETCWRCFKTRWLIHFQDFEVWINMKIYKHVPIWHVCIDIYIYGPASLGTPPPTHPMVMGLYSSAPVPPSPPVVWVVWVVVGGGGGGRSCICMYMNVYVWYECTFLVFVYDCDMICIW